MSFCTEVAEVVQEVILEGILNLLHITRMIRICLGVYCID